MTCRQHIDRGIERFVALARGQYPYPIGAAFLVTGLDGLGCQFAK